MSSCKINKMPEEDDVDQIIRNEFTNDFCENYILIGEDNTCLPKYYADYAESISTLQVHNNDIVVAAYPKTGTTWTQEMVWMIANNLDFKGGEVRLGQRFPFLELCTSYDFEKMDKAVGQKSPRYISESVEFTKQQVSPRFIKTHLPFSLLPQEIQNGSKTPKIVYVVRNPKDVCVSYYHHGKLLMGWRANFERFSKVFLSGKIMYGSYWKHVLGYWERRSCPNVLIIKYEDMKKDLKSVIQDVANFLDKKLTTEQIDLLSKHLSLESMRNNESINVDKFIEIRRQLNLVFEDGSFFRSGQAGKYKEEMPADIIKDFDSWTEENIGDASFFHEYNVN